MSFLPLAAGPTPKLGSLPVYTPYRFESKQFYMTALRQDVNTKQYITVLAFAGRKQWLSGGHMMAYRLQGVATTRLSSLHIL